MPSLRAYQSRAVYEVLNAWRNGARRVCLVMPTGAGKSMTAKAIADAEGGRALWLVHRVELAAQAPGEAVTIQGLLASGKRPECSVLIADECHHLAPSAEQWNSVANYYPKILGLSATPQRQDGSPLGDLFDHLVVGANYSELVSGGYLIAPKVFRPPEALESGVAMKPVQAWKQYVQARQGFAFFSRVLSARHFADELNRDLVNGSVAAAVWGDMDAEARLDALKRFRAGQLRCLANCQILTEGVDIPEACACLLATGCQHASGYLQRVGRIMRPAPSTTDALLVDLVGASHKFGLPHEDRAYSLTGVAITTRRKLDALTVCKQCGCTHPSADAKCPECGRVEPPKPVRQRVWGLPLAEVSLENLTAKDRGILRYRQSLASDPEKTRTLYMKLKNEAILKGYKSGWAAVQFKIRVGRYPGKQEIM